MSRDDLPQHHQHSRLPSFPDDFITEPYRSVPPPGDAVPGDIDDRFVFDFHAYDDDLADGQRWSTWLSVEPLSRGPEPLPDWVVTSQGAIDTELGVLKTGKEADVHLVERADPLDPDAGVVMAAKRYRSSEHRSFHRAASYTEGRSMKRSRDERALKRKSTFGRQVAAGEWAVSEWAALVRLWDLGLPVPYPVQIDGTEILMEWITVVDEDGTVQTAPRLAQTRPSPSCWRRTFSSSPTRSRRWCRTASCTATSRRTTSWRRASGWSSSTCHRSSTWSATSTG